MCAKARSATIVLIALITLMTRRSVRVKCSEKEISGR